MSKSLAGFGATGNLMTKSAAPPSPPPASGNRPTPVHGADRPTGHPALAPTPGPTRPMPPMPKGK